MPSVDQLIHRRYRDARRLIYNGDVLLFRRPASLIARYSDGPYSHAGIATWRTSDVGSTLSCSHSREWHGARTESLSGLVRDNDGCIDVYRPQCSDTCREWIAELAYRHSGHRYNYGGVVLASVMRMPLLRFVLRRIGCAIDPDVTTDAGTQWSTPKFCSQMVIWICRRAGGQRGMHFDPVPNKADAFVTPNDLSHSPLLQYQFTLQWTDLETTTIPRQRVAAVGVAT